MNKKILIGSLLAVFILIMVSFTSVVGYGSVESNVKESPLFNIRSDRAIDKESKDLTCEYVGKGEEITIPLPVRNNREVLLEKIKDRISKMDVEEFNRFKNLIIDKLRDINDGKQVIPSVFLPFCDKLTASYPIICFLDDLYGTIFLILYIILSTIEMALSLLFLFVYILINGDLPPTYFPITVDCCQL